VKRGVLMRAKEDEMADDYPDVWVVLKDGDSHGTKHGTPLTVDLDERIAHYRKCGPCVRYIPAARAERALAALAAISMLDGSREWARTVARAGADGTRHPALDGPDATSAGKDV